MTMAQRTTTAVAGIAAVIALLAAGWFGYGWAHALLVDKPRADARDAALDGAMQAAVYLNSLDPSDLAGGVERMRSTATGDLLEQIDAYRDRLIEIAGRTGAQREATVLSAALTELNPDDDTAHALVVISQTTTPRDEQPTVQRVTWSLDMRVDHGTWRASEAHPVGEPVLVDGPPLRPTPAPPASGGDF